MEGATIKFVVTGDPECGKKTLVSRIRRVKNPESEPGVTHLIDRRIGGNKVNATITDLDGTERFRAATSSTYRGADVVLVMFDASERLDTHKIGEWVGSAERYAPNDACIALVGNKSDKVVSGLGADAEVVKEIAGNHNITHHYYLSALNGAEATECMFFELLRSAHQLKQGKLASSTRKANGQTTDSKKKCCVVM